MKKRRYFSLRLFGFNCRFAQKAFHSYDLVFFYAFTYILKERIVTKLKSGGIEYEKTHVNSDLYIVS